MPIVSVGTCLWRRYPVTAAYTYKNLLSNSRSFVVFFSMSLPSNSPTRYNMVVGPVKLGTRNQCAGKGQQQFSSQYFPKLLVNSDPDYSDMDHIFTCVTWTLWIFCKMSVTRCKMFSEILLSRVCSVTIRRGLDWWIDLLTTYRS
jgi:hypothetical protein